MAVPAFGVLLALGVWQLERMEWKRALIAERVAALSTPPAPLPPGDAFGPDWDFRRVSVRGRFLHDKAQPFGPRLDRPQSLTPLQRRDGGVLLVNRGAATDRPDGELTVEGVLRIPRPPGAFAPEHGPDARLWLWYDLAGLERRLGLALAPAVLETEIPARVDLPDNHLQYALTWFALAAALAAIYLLSQTRRPPE